LTNRKRAVQRSSSRNGETEFKSNCVSFFFGV
jgi:hypothetical protein